jgi:type II secretory ATPase GspE/PulE/Tfp pilus assembly ATPase PilB-like protein
MDNTPLQTKLNSTNSALNTTLNQQNFIDFLVAKNKLNLSQAGELKLKALQESRRMEDVVYDIWDHQDRESFYRYYAEFRNWRYVDMEDIMPDKNVLTAVNKDVFYNHNFIPFLFYSQNNGPETIDTQKVNVVTKDPLDLQGVKLLESILKKQIEIYFSNPEKIKQALDKSFSALFNGQNSNLSDIKNSSSNSNVRSNDDISIINTVNMIMDYAMNHGASDIHIEPKETKVVVRFRLAGILSEKMTIDNIALLPPLTTRVKILADMKIDEHRVPQDGRFEYKNSAKTVDVRVSTVPSVYGEKIVMRLLERNLKPVSLIDLGLRYVNLERIEAVIKNTQGVVLVTGPTGSGKTKTLSAILNLINKPEVNILTLEDPVEIRIDGINQVQVNPEVGLTFANGLRAFLRQDPDIIMVGEIRDEETASLAIQSSLVGRMVYSTLHTNSAASTFTRLLDMGVEKYILLSTIKLSIGQRLVRKLCPYCKKKATLSDIDRSFISNTFNSMNDKFKNSEIGSRYLEKLADISNHVFEPVGCAKCDNTGYLGRVGIFECLIVDEEISTMVKDNLSEIQIQEAACRNGMITMLEDGILRIIDGETSIKEVLRVRY